MDTWRYTDTQKQNVIFYNGPLGVKPVLLLVSNITFPETLNEMPTARGVRK